MTLPSTSWSGVTLSGTNWEGVTLPGGFYYIVDQDGNRIIDDDGNYLVTEATDGTDWTDELTGGQQIETHGGLNLVTHGGDGLVTHTSVATDWTDE